MAEDEALAMVRKTNVEWPKDVTERYERIEVLGTERSSIGVATAAVT